MTDRRILVTSALPYANGPIHIGHLVEYLQTDIWARYQRMQGRRCVYICADDTHGTAIMLRARKEGRSETRLLADMSAQHQADFADFGIRFDHYGSTNSDANRELCARIWSSLREAGLVEQRTVEQLFDAEEGVFLADRFVKGTCPKCGAENQYGDSCDVCGATYSPIDLVNPQSIYSGATPEVRSSEHLFVKIETLHDFLAEWTREHLQEEVANYLDGHFLSEPLRDWDVSRPAPYFGFEIPDAPGHYWYVWFDAPIGYIASTREWCDARGEKLEDWWESEDCEIHHVIGKDIIYFHTLFWPAMLKVAGLSLPRRVQIHGFLTVDGAKMSKSKGTSVSARTYLEHLDPSYLRYYYASKLGDSVDDLDLGLEDFVQKVNSDLVGKVVNLASRSAKFVDTLSDAYPADGGLFAAAAAEGEAIAEAYEGFRYGEAMRRVMALADRANEFVERAAPWTLRKDPDKAGELRDVCTIALNLYRQLAIYLAPVLPRLQEQTAEWLGCPMDTFSAAGEPLVGRSIGKFKHLMKRAELDRVQAMIDASVVADETPAPASDDPDLLSEEPIAETCTFDDFMAVDLRVARVLEAETIPEARKLLKLTLGLGGDETRTVFAGIKSAYEPESLVGRLVVMAANLAPRRMKFGVSEGMVLAAGPGKSEIFVLSPDDGAKPGMRVS